MKMRQGFVSNSSSSSFVCQVCKHEECGYDLSLRDAGMVHCQNGHTFCTSHMTKPLEIVIDKLVQEELEKTPLEPEDDIDEVRRDIKCEIRWAIPTQYCPICQLVHITEHQMLEYLLTKYKLTREEVQQAMRRLIYIATD